MQIKLVSLAVLVLFYSAVAQVAPPKHESNSAHVKNSRAQNYSQRFDAIKCALVLISRTGGVGTGMFIGPNGDVATASHVLGDRTFKTAADGTFEAGINMPESFTITDCHGTATTVPSTNVETNGDSWGADLAVFKSGVSTHDWLQLSSSPGIKPGTPLITMGFPGLAWGSLSIYSGISSTDDKVKLDVIVGVTSDTHQGVKPTNEFVQLQMPISPGLSGSPIIDTENQVVGIVTQAGSSTPMVDLLIQLNHLNAFGVPGPPVASPLPGQSVNLNAFSILAEFAEHLRNFASPGYGDAVPIRYLKRGSQQHQQPASPSR
jgi:S1-C subfamily serine protease